MGAKLVVLFTGCFLLMGCLENQFIYFPAKYPQGCWDVEAIPFPVEDCYFEAEDGIRLHGWFSPCPGSRGALLWLHGNAGNLSGRLEHLRLLRERLEMNIFIIDYRGYGRSGGEPSEKGLYKDAAAAYRYLAARSEADPGQIFVYGQSLGAAVAAYLAAEGMGAALIMEAGFSSLLAAAADVYPWLPARLLTRERYDSLKRMGKIKIPVLFIHGSADNIVDPAHSERLYRVASEPKELLMVRGAGHNDLFYAGRSVYWQRLRDFLRPREAQPL